MTEEEYYSIARNFVQSDAWKVAQRDSQFMHLFFELDTYTYRTLFLPILNNPNLPEHFNMKKCLLSYFGRCADVVHYTLSRPCVRVPSEVPDESDRYFSDTDMWKERYYYFALDVYLYFETSASMNRFKIAQPELYNAQ